LSESLADRIISGDRRAIAKAITIVENKEKGARELLERIDRNAGKSFVLGITGPPGTGKSTLVNRLIERYRKKGLRVGIIAVDPTSPITGGALLGDRIRMVNHTTDQGVFIRSMASRGWSGGLSAAIVDVVRVIDASGTDIIIIETVGIGQADIEIMKVAHATVVVLMPAMGDDIQVSKAGLMEIGDVYVINKSDLEGADSMVLNLLGMIREARDRKSMVVKVSALKDQGMEELMKLIEEIRSKFSTSEGKNMKLRSTSSMMVEAAKNRILNKFEKKLKESPKKLAEQVIEHKISFEEAVNRLIES
jgi:LAO/AO transport system kinase